MTRFLSLEQVPDPVGRFEFVETPEFGNDESGDPLGVNAHEMTVHKKNVLSSFANKFYEENGELKTKQSLEHDSACIIAAICSYDDNGNLVFGVDYEDAIGRVEALPEKYRPAVFRIMTTVLKLTADNAMTINTNELVKEAKKK
jgi:antitoxin component YwqK of YwqJK toxin-antitoxin module